MWYGPSSTDSRCYSPFVGDEGEGRGRGEFVTALKEGEFDEEGEADDVGTDFAEEATGGGGGPSGGKEVVDHDDAFAGLNGILMDFEGVFSVFELVAFLGGGGGEFARLADEDEAAAEFLGEGSAKEKATGFDGDELGDFLFAIVLGEQLDNFAEGIGVLEEGCDVL